MIVQEVDAPIVTKGGVFEGTPVPSYKEHGNGPVLLFLHGLGGNRHCFDRQLDALSGRYRCVAWDVPGYGGSAPMAAMTFPDLAARLDHLIDVLGTEPHAVIGHSFGGMIAQAWLRLGGACGKLILAHTSAAFGKPGSRWNEDFLKARLKPIDEGLAPRDFARQLITSMFFDRSKAAAIEAAVRTMAPLPATTYRQVIECLVAFDERAHLERIRTPTLCLAAQHDRTMPPKSVADMAQRIPGAKYQCLPDAGHLAYVEAPEAFTAAIAAFVAH
ncbi:MAG: alpha/beta fold hydrolase [Gammaproteobacteria bacterium]|nr:alpha/beta fold hydrolase [Gammaproteobacteria bacterium]MYH17136.1 alpha/beta fold hydrolase [Gammaproteobacteria bacterium]MYK81059.1 alpha/beta fold hydrolase [Gammaproteobacteria bacterium]